MSSNSGPLVTRRIGPQPAARLPQQSASTSVRLETSSMNSKSSFFAQPGDQREKSNGQRSSPYYDLPKHSQYRPFFRPFTGQFNYSTGSNGIGRNSSEDWRRWVELGIKIFDLPAITTTRDLWQRFSQEGNIVYVELYENTSGQPDGKACVRFRYDHVSAVWPDAFRKLTVLALHLPKHSGRIGGSICFYPIVAPFLSHCNVSSRGEILLILVPLTRIRDIRSSWYVCIAIYLRLLMYTIDNASRIFRHWHHVRPSNDDGHVPCTSNTEIFDSISSRHAS